MLCLMFYRYMLFHVVDLSFNMYQDWYLSWFHSFVITADLASRKCVPCVAKDLQAMSEQSTNELLAQVQNDLLTYLFFSFTRHVSDACLIEQVHGWGLITEGGVLKLHRSWKVKSFTKGLEFFQLVAEIAEAEGCVKTSEDLFLLYWYGLSFLYNLHTNNFPYKFMHVYLTFLRFRCLSYFCNSSNLV